MITMLCKQVVPAQELLRIAADGEQACFDVRRKLGGRGAWLHPNQACLQMALKRRSIPFALKTAVQTDQLALQLEGITAHLCV